MVHLSPMSESQLSVEISLSIENRPDNSSTLALHRDQLKRSQTLEDKIISSLQCKMAIGQTSFV